MTSYPSICSISGWSSPSLGSWSECRGRRWVIRDLDAIVVTAHPAMTASYVTAGAFAGTRDIAAGVSGATNQPKRLLSLKVGSSG